MRGLARELLVERDLPPQHSVDNVGGDAASSEAGDFRLWGTARTRHAFRYYRELWLPREAIGKNVSGAQVYFTRRGRHFEF